MDRSAIDWCGLVALGLLSASLGCGGGGGGDGSLADDGAGSTDSADSTGGEDAGDGDGDGDGPPHACAPYLSWDGADYVDIDECARRPSLCGDAGVFTCINRLGSPPTCAWDASEAYAAITAGVNEIPGFVGPPNASALVLFDDRAKPVLTSGGSVVAAISYLGLGRLFVMGHPAYVAGELANLDTTRLLQNAAAWAGGGGATARVGVAPGLDALAAALMAGGLEVVQGELEDLSDLDAYVPDAPAISGAEVEALLAFAKGGGGLLIAAEAMTTGAWGLAANGVTYEGGIVAVQQSVGGVDLVTSETPRDVLNASTGFQALADLYLNDQALSEEDASLARAAGQVGLDELLVTTFEGFFCRAEAFADAYGDVIPTRADPVNEFEEPDRALALRIDMKLQAERAPELVEAHESVPDYPGAVLAGASPKTESVTIDASYEGRDPRYLYAGAQADVWRTTGLYAKAGEAIRVTTSADGVGVGLSAQIGVHADLLWSLNEWERIPEMPVSRSIDSATVELASGFGGPVVLRVPVGVDAGSVEVSIEGAYEAPRFVAGETTDEEWLTAREAPAPWASFETPKLVFFVPSTLIRTLEGPTALMSVWDEILDADATLSAIPLDRPRAEMVVADRQISAGWMHSGYPIMANIDASPNFVDLANLQTSGEWGVLHELGHNHQWSLMQLPGATECTVNLWSVYASEEVLGISRDVAHSALTPADRQARTDAYIAGGANFEQDWSVWTCLETYLQLEEGFGWQPHISLFGDFYQPLPSNTSWDTETRASEYAVAFSQAVQRDLGPFFTSWGWPLSPAALTAMAAFPEWTENPMPAP